jgi:hypothetical protein
LGLREVLKRRWIGGPILGSIRLSSPSYRAGISRLYGTGRPKALTEVA